MKTKKFALIINFSLIAILCIYVIFFSFKNATNYEIYSEQKENTQIYTIWHIETFEGGSKARIDYLKTIARQLEKQNPLNLFMIKPINPENIKIELENSTPDIISFGYGVGNEILPYLQVLNSSYNVRYELVESCLFNNQIYCLPYIVSGYAEFKHDINSTEFHCGTNNYTKPQNIYTSNPIEIESQYEAYKDFVNNKKVHLLGTARDVFRVDNLNKIGRTNATIYPVNTYTDLLQYIGIINTNSTTNQFIEHIFKQDNQLQLVNYSLFSSLHTKLYNSGIYNDMENAILTAKIAGVFDE